MLALSRIDLVMLFENSLRTAVFLMQIYASKNVTKNIESG